MKKMARSLVVLGLFAFTGTAAAPAAAQQGHGYTQVVSANPFGLLLDRFNAEYERGITESTTIGIGGSLGTEEEENDTGETRENTFFNGDVFWRFYPSGSWFEGWNFGIKVGVTKQEGTAFFGSEEYSTTNFGYGFDANRSWLMGKNNNFYVGVGFGLKRLVGDLPEGALEYIPTLRIVNVGIAF